MGVGGRGGGGVIFMRIYIYIYSMNEEKTKIASYVVMFSLHMCSSFIFADFQDKPMGAVSVLPTGISQLPT